MINALYDSNILDSKILAYALLKISLKDYTVIDNVAIEVEFRKDELCEMLNLNNDSRIYNKLGTSAHRMLQKHAIEYDTEKKRFMGFVLFDSAYFDKGVYTLRFGMTMSKVLMHLKNRYTLLSLDTMLKFTQNSALRLYEELKSVCFGEKSGVYKQVFSVSKLRFMLGTINTKELDDKKAEKYTRGEDYDGFYEYALQNDEVCFKEDREFFRSCFYPAVEEVNELSDLNITYTPIKKEHGKITGFSITIKQKKVEKKQPGIDEKTFEVVAKMFPLLTEPDINSIISVAHGDLAVISKAYACYVQQKSSINDPTAWIISAIKDSYEPQEIRIKKDKTPAWDFGEKNDYDNVKIEKMLLTHNTF